MHKTGKFFYLLLIFAPAAAFLLSYQGWAALAVGVLNPVRAVSARGAESDTYPVYGAPSPFRDFTFEKSSSAPPPAGQSFSEGDYSKNRAYKVQDRFFTSEESDNVLKKEDCYVKNLTHMNRREVKQLMLSPIAFKREKNSSQPQILIMHTHATESYTPTASQPYDPDYAFRDTDTANNMVAVGKVMADTLNSLGYNTIQDATLHDYPSYNGSYDNSKATVESYLEKYPSIKIVLDVHRDAVEREGRIINPTVTINGWPHAQIMIISGADNGYMNMPNFRENLKFATLVQNRAAKDWPGLMRPVLFDYRNYNQQLTTGSILVEIGTHGSSLQRAKNSAAAFAKSLAGALDSLG